MQPKNRLENLFAFIFQLLLLSRKCLLASNRAPEVWTYIPEFSIYPTTSVSTCDCELGLFDTKEEIFSEYST